MSRREKAVNGSAHLVYSLLMQYLIYCTTAATKSICACAEHAMRGGADEQHDDPPQMQQVATGNPHARTHTRTHEPHTHMHTRTH